MCSACDEPWNSSTLVGCVDRSLNLRSVTFRLILGIIRCWKLQKCKENNGYFNLNDKHWLWNEWNNRKTEARNVFSVDVADKVVNWSLRRNFFCLQTKRLESPFLNFPIITKIKIHIMNTDIFRENKDSTKMFLIEDYWHIVKNIYIYISEKRRFNTVYRVKYKFFDSFLSKLHTMAYRIDAFINIFLLE